MSNSKYEITDIAHKTYPFLHRIRALQDIGDWAKAGDLGGFVESESNLAVDPDDAAWIFNDAIACGSTYVDHSGHSQGACCMMIATDSETTKQNAWQFMKWWTSTDAQVRFGREIEAVLGSSARYATANIAAIEQLSWSEAQLAVIREQMTWAVGFREVAGGYYTTRHMTNAVRKVTNDKTDPRETLLDYARTINEEINKKRLEFGLPIDEETP